MPADVAIGDGQGVGNTASTGDANVASYLVPVVPRVGAGPSVQYGFWIGLMMLATGSAFDGDLRRGLTEVGRALARVGPRRDHSDALLAQGLLLLWSGRLVEAEATFDAILDAGDELGPLLTRVSAGYSRADCRFRRGAWDAALADAEELIALMEAGDHDLVRPMAHGVAAFVHACRGNTADAERHLANGRAAQLRSDNTSGLLWLMVGEARIGSASGDHQRVVDQLGPLASMLRRSRVGEGVQPWRADLVEALVALGRHDEAADALTELDERTGSGGEQARIGAARARGLLAAALGDDPSAEAAFAAGLAPAAPAEGGPFLRARLELAAGSFARRRGRRRRRGGAGVRARRGALAGGAHRRPLAQRGAAPGGRQQRGRGGVRLGSIPRIGLDVRAGCRGTRDGVGAARGGVAGG